MARQRTSKKQRGARQTMTSFILSFAEKTPAERIVQEGKLKGHSFSAAYVHATSTRASASLASRRTTTSWSRSAVMMLRQVERPRPVPLPTGFVVKNGSKMRRRTAAGIPGPLSRTLRPSRVVGGARIAERRVRPRARRWPRRRCEYSPPLWRTGGRWRRLAPILRGWVALGRFQR